MIFVPWSSVRRWEESQRTWVGSAAEILKHECIYQTHLVKIVKIFWHSKFHVMHMIGNSLMLSSLPSQGSSNHVVWIQSVGNLASNRLREREFSESSSISISSSCPGPARTRATQWCPPWPSPACPSRSRPTPPWSRCARSSCPSWTPSSCAWCSSSGRCPSTPRSRWTRRAPGSSAHSTEPACRSWEKDPAWKYFRFQIFQILVAQLYIASHIERHGVTTLIFIKYTALWTLVLISMNLCTTAQSTMTDTNHCVSSS